MKKESKPVATFNIRSWSSTHGFPISYQNNRNRNILYFNILALMQRTHMPVFFAERIKARQRWTTQTAGFVGDREPKILWEQRLFDSKFGVNRSNSHIDCTSFWVHSYGQLVECKTMFMYHLDQGFKNVTWPVTKFLHVDLSSHNHIWSGGPTITGSLLFRVDRMRW
jgi:hypothetical protein